MKKVNNKGVHINGYEAARIWEHINRGTKLDSKYEGMIPHSLELIKLKSEGLIELVKKSKYKLTVDDKGKEIKKFDGYEYVEADKRTLKNAKKTYSDDLINVKFGQGVKNIEQTIKAIKESRKKSIEKLLIKNADDTDLNEQIEKINNPITYENLNKMAEENPTSWNKSIKVDELRSLLYTEGFTLNGIKYKLYKRSSAKARTGECLFIREELYEVMTKWSHMQLDFTEAGKIDVSSLAAYEALCASTIEETIKINPKNILLIDDVESVFKHTANTINKMVLVKKTESKMIGNKAVTSCKQTGVKLFSSQGEGTVKNSLWDGQGLLDSSRFTGDYEGKGMVLTRQHFFKSCLFNTNIQQFMRDHFGSDYDTATIKDALGNKMKVEDIHCIITPSSLKIFKFSDLKGSDKAMYKHWQSIVKGEKNVFGVCKSESPTKRGELEGKPLQRMSYQMLNSLPSTKQQIEQLSKFEVGYINEMKSDIDKFIEHLEVTKNFTNSNEMMIQLYKHNNDIAKTTFFNEFKINEINDYVRNVKKGRVRIVGDYCTLLGNPYEMLLHSVECLDVNNLKSHSLIGAEVYTPLFNDGDDLTGFRNPHTSANCILKSTNKYNKNIKTYFNLTNNIVAVNAIEFPLQDILSGSDYDSDTCLLSNDKTLHNITKDINGTYHICLNGVAAKSNKHEWTEANRALVDDTISSDLIGKIVNQAQIAQSIYYDSDLKNEEMKEVIEIISVASTISIDLAKRQYSIDINKELDRLTNLVSKYKKNGSYPEFMRITSKKTKTVSYNTPMDYVCEIFATEKGGLLNRADELKAQDIINVWDLIMKCDENGEVFEIAKANDKQEKEIIELVNNYACNIDLFKSQLKGANESKKQRMIKAICDESLDFNKAMEIKKITPVTIYSILYHMFYTESIKANQIKILNALYINSKTKFLNGFVKSDEKMQRK